VAALRALGRHLDPGGFVVYSAALIGAPLQWLELVLLWLGRRLSGRRHYEFGDWCTAFLTPAGDIGTSFLHRARPGAVRREARAAGFRVARREGAGHLVAEEFHGGAAGFKR
jgi:hypothetical protein